MDRAGSILGTGRKAPNQLLAKNENANTISPLQLQYESSTGEFISTGSIIPVGVQNQLNMSSDAPSSLPIIRSFLVI